MMSVARRTHDSADDETQPPPTLTTVHDHDHDHDHDYDHDHDHDPHAPNMTTATTTITTTAGFVQVEYLMVVQPADPVNSFYRYLLDRQEDKLAPAVKVACICCLAVPM